MTSFRITESYKIRCYSYVISHSSIQTDHLSYVIYPLNCCCISRHQTGEWPMSCDQFDMCRLKSLKFQREYSWESRQTLKCCMHPVAPGWSKPLLKLNYHRDLKDYAYWANCRFQSFTPNSHQRGWHLYTNNRSSRFGSAWMELFSQELIPLSQLGSFCFRVPM